MTKANKDGWIRHRGGKCPVTIGDKIDVRYRNGNVEVITADEHDEANEIWKHVNDYDDIMAWRPHKAEQATTKQSLEVETPAKQDGPLQWRDRIHAIDFDKAAAQKTHEAAMAALDSERAELVAKLKAEGLALICNKASEAPAFKDWRVGDLIEVISESDQSEAKKGMLLPIVNFDRNDADAPVKLDGGYWPGLHQLRWHSRPSN